MSLTRAVTRTALAAWLMAAAVTAAASPHFPTPPAPAVRPHAPAVHVAVPVRRGPARVLHGATSIGGATTTRSVGHGPQRSESAAAIDGSLIKRRLPR